MKGNHAMNKTFAKIIVVTIGVAMVATTLLSAILFAQA